MFALSSQIRVLAYCQPTDMRKSYEGLSRLARKEMGQDVLSGVLCLFTNRRRNRAKILWYDGTGLCVLCKRLEKGQFAALWQESDEPTLSLTRAELELFLHGCKLVGKIPLSPAPLSRQDLAVRSRVCA